MLGAIIGSFLGAILIRWPQERSVARGRSACDHCGAVLGPSELIPILSFLIQRGRCRRCGGVIDRRIWFTEIAAALIGAVALTLLPPVEGLGAALFGWWLLILAALDLEHHWLPDALTLPLIPAGLVTAWLGIGPDLSERVIGIGLGWSALLLIGGVYRLLRGRDGLGGGDPKLLGAVGAWLGVWALPFVLLGAGALGLVAVAVMKAMGRPVEATTRLPLGTLMAVAAWPIWLGLQSDAIQPLAMIQIIV